MTSVVGSNKAQGENFRGESNTKYVSDRRRLTCTTTTKGAGYNGRAKKTDKYLYRHLFSSGGDVTDDITKLYSTKAVADGGAPEAR